MSSPLPPGYAAPMPPATPRSGCWKTGLIGCGIAALVILLGVIAGVLYLRKNPQAVTDYVMKQVEANYASDVTEQEKSDLRVAYAEFRKRMSSGNADGRAFERVRGVILRGGQNQITREQVRDLTEAFRQASGSSVRTPAGPGAAETPTPVP